MEIRNRLPLLAAMVIAFTGLAFYGGLTANEPALGIGIGAAFVCFVMMPAFHLRAKRLRKICEKENALIRFEYDLSEIKEIAVEQKKLMLKKSIRLSVLFSVCLAVIFLPFVLFSMEPDSELPPMLPVALTCVLLPWLSIIIAPYVVSNTIQARPCVSLIGRDYVLIANRYHGVNDRYQLHADRIRFEKGKGGKMGCLSVRYSFKAMSAAMPRIFNLWVQIPVPHGRENDAAALHLE
jgi:hypothetical protein